MKKTYIINGTLFATVFSQLLKCCLYSRSYCAIFSYQFQNKNDNLVGMTANNKHWVWKKNHILYF